MKKQAIIALIVLLLSIGLSLFAYSYAVTPKQQHEFIDQEHPTLPTVSFIIEGYTANELVGYVDDINITTTRDTLTPLDYRGFATVNIEHNNNVIEEVTYELTSLDGKVSLLSGNIEEVKEAIHTIDFNMGATTSVETILKITIHLKDKTVDYYTRIISYEDLKLKDNMEYVEMLHGEILNPSKDTQELSKHFTSDVATKNNLNEVTQDCAIGDVLWGELSPTVVGDVEWKILDSTSVFTGIELRYIVETVVDGVKDYYHVSEFYRTGYGSVNKAVYLSQYKRKMEQIFSPVQQDIGYRTLTLGIRNEQIQYKESENIEYLAFVQERELWTFHLPSNEFVKVFTFHPNPYGDENLLNPKGLLDNHDITILEVDNNGNVIFTVYGYMNSGIHEGKVGTSIYYYDNQENGIKEQTFVQSSDAYALARESLSKGIYYSQEAKAVYMVAQGAIYKVDLEQFTQEKLTDNLEINQYTVSSDGGMIAYNSGKENLNTRVTVLNIDSGVSYQIKSSDGEELSPLIFLADDIICGYSKVEDQAMDQVGTTIQPYYKLEIRNQTNEIVKTYEKKDNYISHVEEDSRMLTIHQLEKEDGVYIPSETDFISNNAEEEISRVETSYLLDDKKGKEQVFKMPKTLAENKLVETEAKLIYNPNVLCVSYQNSEKKNEYYVYAYGDMLGRFQNLGAAITLASDHYGAVVNAEQSYIWRRSARDLRYSSSMESVWKKNLMNKQKPLDILTQAAGKQVLTYTGANVEQMCYLINKGQMILAQFTDNSWAIFVGYDGDTIYYLNENGNKESAYMSKLNTKIKELIGTGKF